MQNHPTVRKAVIPAAGLGSRFLPATKASPKEMLPIVDKPIIQYAVEEAAAAGITHIIFITGRTKRALEDHFDTAYELEAQLAAQHKTELLKLAQSTAPKGVTFSYVRQAQPLGLGHAVLCAAPLVGNELFAVLLPDDFIHTPQGAANATAQLIAAQQAHNASVIAVREVARSETQHYGIVATKNIDALNGWVTAMVEKPTPDKAPSTLAAIGRYVLQPSIFAALDATPRGAGGEIQLTDALAALAQAPSSVLAHRFSGERYDCGSKLGYLQATVEMALRHPEVGAAFQAYLQGKLK